MLHISSLKTQTSQYCVIQTIAPALKLSVVLTYLFFITYIMSAKNGCSVCWSVMRIGYIGFALTQIGSGALEKGESQKQVVVHSSWVCNPNLFYARFLYLEHFQPFGLHITIYIYKYIYISTAFLFCFHSSFKSQMSTWS